MTPKPQLLIVGDSHTWYFNHAAKVDLFHPLDTEVLSVMGATAVGMRNPESKTDAIGQFRNFLRGRNKNSVIVLHLGENDCGFVIWYRAQKYNEPVEVQTRQSIDAYFAFVDELLAEGFRNIIITGSTFPTFETGEQGPIATQRSSISATRIERTQLTHEYNRQLRDQAERRGLPFVDIADDVLDPRTGIVKPDFRIQKPGDPHMHFGRAAAAWAARIFPIAAPLLAPPGILRAWTPVNAENFVKATPADGAKLPADLRVGVRKPSFLTGQYHGFINDHYILSGVRVNGTLLHPRFRLLRNVGWREVPLVKAMVFYSKETVARANDPDGERIFKRSA